MSQEAFDKHFRGSKDDLASVTLSDGTQMHGKLLKGFVPMRGYRLDEAGFVVPAESGVGDPGRHEDLRQRRGGDCGGGEQGGWLHRRRDEHAGHGDV
jgi:hypothetical protein